MAAPQAELTPEQTIGVAINAIATQSSFTGVLHDAARLARVLDAAGLVDLSAELRRTLIALGASLSEITALTVPNSAALDLLAAQIDSREAADDMEADSGADDPL